MIISGDNAKKTHTDNAKGGVGFITGFQYVGEGARPNPTRVAMAAVNTIRPGYSLGYHAHETNEEVFFILEGQGIYLDNDGQEYPVTKGDFTICRQGEKHGMFNRSDAPLVFAAVIVDSGQ
jgi:mannose-6-phosphate isomerase-like protein (cupin superfamily)